MIRPAPQAFELPLAQPLSLSSPHGRHDLKQVAQQFESLFAQMLVGSMRQSTPGDPFGSSGGDMYRDLYDREVATQLAKRGSLGIADMMMRQLGGTPEAKTLPVTMAPLPSKLTQMTQAYRAAAPVAATPSPAAPAAPETASAAGANAASNDTAKPAGVGDNPRRAFVDRVWPHARRAAAELGIEPAILVAQAALETGWGRSKLARESNNIFGIKSGSRWSGGSVSLPTTEVVNGQETRPTAAFRAYDAMEQSFSDYVNLIKSNPRYAQALAAGTDSPRYAQALQSAGYATDPAYAAKLVAIANGPALREALAGNALAGSTPHSSTAGDKA